MARMDVLFIVQNVYTDGSNENRNEGQRAKDNGCYE